jgi:RHS repeat-associated protein
VYDGYGSGRLGAALTSTSGVSNHANLSSKLRGNVTQITRGQGVNGGSSIEDIGYNDLGQVTARMDGNAAVTSYGYTDNFAGLTGTNTQAFLTAITHPSVNGVAALDRYQYYFSLGSVAASCGENYPTSQACATQVASASDYAWSTYDPSGRLETVTRGDSGVDILSYLDATHIEHTRTATPSPMQDEIATYDGIGQKISVARLGSTGTNGAQWIKTDNKYDYAGRLTAVSNPYVSGTPSWTTTTYDGIGRVMQVQNPDNSSKTMCVGGYRLVQSAVCGQQNLAPTFESYSITDENHSTSTVFKDPAGQQRLVVEANNAETTYSYDALGNLTYVNQQGITGESARVRAFSYDSLSQITQVCNPETLPSGTSCDRSHWSDLYSYDLNSNLHTKNDARGVLTTYNYDALNRLTSKTYSDGTPTANFGYDQTGIWGVASCGATGFTQCNTIGRMSSMSAGSSGAIFTYDALGRMTGKSVCIATLCGSDRVDQFFTYDLAGNLTSYDHGTDVARQSYYGAYKLTYDSASRLSQFDTLQPVGLSTPPVTLLGNMSYGPVGLVTSTLGNGFVESRTYDVRTRQTGYSVIAASSPMVTQYSWTLSLFDPAGNVSSSSDTVNGNNAYLYDNLNRLTAATWGGTNAYQWSYDSFGNRLSQTVLAGTGITHSDTFSGANNQADGLMYDAVGNALTDMTHVGQFSYDAEGRVSSSDSTSYLYDALGQRVAKYNGGALTNVYLYDNDSHVVTELDANFNLVRKEIYAGVRHLGTYDASGNLTYVLTDWLGTTRAISDNSGAVCQTTVSQPFGGEEQQSGSCSASPVFFTGKERDTESGLDYFGARYYGSSMGRFTSPDDGTDQDPSKPQSWNLYSYVRNNPVTGTDPDGRLVNVCTTRDDGTQKCSLVENHDYAASQQGNNGSLKVPTLNQVGMNGNGSGQFNATNITDASGNIVGTATYVSTSGADFYANRTGIDFINTQTAPVVNTMAAITIGAVASMGIVASVELAGGAELINLDGLSEGATSQAPKLVIRTPHLLHAMRVAVGHSTPLGSATEIRLAIQAALAAGAYTVGPNGVANGVAVIQGVTHEFTGFVNGSQFIFSNIYRQ